LPLLKARELREKSTEELRRKLEELRNELFEERVHAALGGVARNPAKIRNLKKQIARILTVLRERGEAER